MIVRWHQKVSFLNFSHPCSLLSLSVCNATLFLLQKKAHVYNELHCYKVAQVKKPNQTPMGTHYHLVEKSKEERKPSYHHLEPLEPLVVEDSSVAIPTWLFNTTAAILLDCVWQNSKQGQEKSTNNEGIFLLMTYSTW